MKCSFVFSLLSLSFAQLASSAVLPNSKRDTGNETSCPAGKALVAGNCQACQPGNFQPEDNYTGISCKPCQAGYYSELQAATVCKLCPVGNYQPKSGQSSCVPCSGIVSPDGTKCVKGCQPGQFVSSSGDCSPCAPGMVQNLVNFTGDTCTACPPGRFAMAFGSITCAECPIGFYNDKLGAMSCTPCPKGMTTDGTGSVMCKMAVVGN